MTVTEPCVSPTTGTLEPDLRVNYAYGMVLGVDEFLQEQLHRLSKGSLHERALHGYGTVSGLAVSVAAAGATDYTVTVTTGIAIDQWGREVVIRCDQCARLGAWLGVQEQADPGTIAQRLDADGRLTVYVVASYAECLDALVPLPGRPCSSSDQTMAPSRIRDAWDVDLRWDAPPMPRWDSDRRLARLLASVEMAAGLPEADSDEEEITDAVLALLDRADDGPDDLGPPTGTTWQLPLESAAEALSRIFTVWVTRVRPGLVPDLIQPQAESEPAILLGRITFEPASPFDPVAPEILGCDDPVEEGRPYLLHTELIQELRWLGESVAAPTPAPEPPPPVTLVTLSATVDEKDFTRIDAWFHTEKPVGLPERITVTDERGTSHDFRTSAVDANGDPTDFSFVWTLTSPDNGIFIEDGLQVGALFPATGVLVGDPGTSLLDVEDAATAPFVDQDEQDGDVTAYAIVRGRAGTVTVQKAKATKSFVDITTMLDNGEQLVLELWFHLQPTGFEDNVRMLEFEDKIFDEVSGQQVSIAQLARSQWSPNVWYMAVKHPNPGTQPVYLRHLFPTYEATVETPDGKMSLEEWIDHADITYLGWDEQRLEVIAFSRSAFVRGQELDIRPFEGDQPVVRPVRRPPADQPPIRERVVTPVADAPVKKAVARKATPRKATPRKATTRKATPRKAVAKAPAKKGGGHR